MRRSRFGIVDRGGVHVIIIARRSIAQRRWATGWVVVVLWGPDEMAMDLGLDIIMHCAPLASHVVRVVLFVAVETDVLYSWADSSKDEMFRFEMVLQPGSVRERLLATGKVLAVVHVIHLPDPKKDDSTSPITCVSLCAMVWLLLRTVVDVGVGWRSGHVGEQIAARRLNIRMCSTRTRRWGELCTHEQEVGVGSARVLPVSS